VSPPDLGIFRQEVLVNTVA